jgi:hypothetical protein
MQTSTPFVTVTQETARVRDDISRFSRVRPDSLNTHRIIHSGGRPARNTSRTAAKATKSRGRRRNRSEARGDGDGRPLLGPVTRLRRNAAPRLAGQRKPGDGDRARILWPVPAGWTWTVRSAGFLVISASFFRRVFLWRREQVPPCRQRGSECRTRTGSRVRVGCAATATLRT